MATDRDEELTHPGEYAPEHMQDNAADTGLEFSIGQSTGTGKGPGSGSGSLDGTDTQTDRGPGLDFSDDEDDDRRAKTQDHDLGGARSERNPARDRT